MGKKKVKIEPLREVVKQENQQKQAQDEDSFSDEEFSEQSVEMDEPITDEDLRVMNKIQERMMEVQEEQKLAWGAIYGLKKREKQIYQKMDQEMQEVLAKYEHLKAPLIDKIARVASGHPVEPQLYTHELTQQISNDKKPGPIPGFWVGVLESMGFIDSENDHKIMENCVSMICARIKQQREGQAQEQMYSAILRFQENELVKSKDLKLILVKKEGEIKKKEQSEIKFKTKVPPEESTIRAIFDPETPLTKLYQYMEDLYRAYSNSVFFYFYETKIPQSFLDENQQFDFNQAEAQQQQEIIRSIKTNQIPEQERMNPKKRVKTNPKKTKPMIL